MLLIVILLSFKRKCKSIEACQNKKKEAEREDMEEIEKNRKKSKLKEYQRQYQVARK